MSDSLTLTGGCGCGAVRFAVNAPLVGAAYCHCTRCQKRTGGGASASARARSGSVTITQGSEQVRDWTLNDGMSKAFCALCGTHLFARDRDTGEIGAIRMSAFDADPGIRPMFRQFVADAAVWEPIPADGLPRFDVQPPAGWTPPATA